MICEVSYLQAQCNSPPPVSFIEAAKCLMLLALPAVVSPRGPFKKCRELTGVPAIVVIE